MVSARPEDESLEEKLEQLRLEGADADADLLKDLKRIMNDPKYLDSAEEEIE